MVTPHPAAHARWADKRVLAWLRDETLVRLAGLDADETRHLRATIPATELVEATRADVLATRPGAGRRRSGAARGRPEFRVRRRDLAARRTALPRADDEFPDRGWRVRAGARAWARKKGARTHLSPPPIVISVPGVGLVVSLGISCDQAPHNNAVAPCL